MGPSVRVGPQSHVPTQESGHANRGQPHTHVGSHGIGNLDIHIRPRPTRHERPHTLRMATQQWRHNGRPRYTMGVHMIIRTATKFWATTHRSVQPRDIVGAQMMCVYSHARDLMGAHGYIWKATRLMWAPTWIYAPPPPVMGDHYRG